MLKRLCNFTSFKPTFMKYRSLQVLYFSTFCIAEWPPFWKELLTLLTICSLCILTICDFSYFRFGFEGGIWVLIALPLHTVLLLLKIFFSGYLFFLIFSQVIFIKVTF